MASHTEFDYNGHHVIIRKERGLQKWTIAAINELATGKLVKKEMPGSEISLRRACSMAKDYIGHPQTAMEKELADLRRWKREEMAVTMPFIEYMQGRSDIINAGESLHQKAIELIEKAYPRTKNT